MRYTPWLGLILACGSVRAQAPSLERIERIERGLMPPVVVKGEEVRWTIEDRMQAHKIQAVSIAVFDHSELQWAKAFGISEAETATRATEKTIFLAGSITSELP